MAVQADARPRGAAACTGEPGVRLGDRCAAHLALRDTATTPADEQPRAALPVQDADGARTVLQSSLQRVGEHIGEQAASRRLVAEVDDIESRPGGSLEAPARVSRESGRGDGLEGRRRAHERASGPDAPGPLERHLAARARPGRAPPSGLRRPRRARRSPAGREPVPRRRPAPRPPRTRLFAPRPNRRCDRHRAGSHAPGSCGGLHRGDRRSRPQRSPHPAAPRSTSLRTRRVHERARRGRLPAATRRAPASPVRCRRLPPATGPPGRRPRQDRDPPARALRSEAMPPAGSAPAGPRTATPPTGTARRPRVAGRPTRPWQGGAAPTARPRTRRRRRPPIPEPGGRATGRARSSRRGRRPRHPRERGSRRRGRPQAGRAEPGRPGDGRAMRALPPPCAAPRPRRCAPR